MAEAKKRSGLTIRSMCAVALFSAVLCVLSLVAVPLPFTSVPVTLGTLGIFLASLILGTRDGTLAVLVFILLGACGLPVFSSFRGGLSVLLSPTGGYIIGYIPCALICGVIVGHFEKRVRDKYLPLIMTAGAMAGMLACYACGAAQFSAVTDSTFKATVVSTILPFIPLDFAKALLAALVAKRIKKHIR